MKVLVTGFQPFAGREINVSEEVALRLEATGNFSVRILPVSFKRAFQSVIQYLEADDSVDLLVMLGETGTTHDHIRLERVAVNLKDCMTADSDGDIFDEEPLIPEAPAAYFTRVPIKRICSMLRNEGHKVKITNSAGTYVCNGLYYNVLHYVDRREKDLEAVFIHLPASQEWVTLDEMERSIIRFIDIYKEIKTFL